MTVRERFLAVLNNEKPDRIPVIEWASWWSQTRARWNSEGLDPSLDRYDLYDYFGLDKHVQVSLKHSAADCPRPASTGAGIMKDEADYDRLLPLFYPKDAVSSEAENLKAYAKLHEKGDIAVWMTLPGAFWFPRTLFGIEEHLYSFYDHPELYHRILGDLANFHIAVIEEFCGYLTPDFMSFAEDMSYNLGPMLSEEHFYEFLAPYYRKVIPVLKSHGIKVIVDTDGDVTSMISWLIDVGIEGILPLERQAGVDVNQIKKDFPGFLQIGAFDKTIMHNGEEAMRKEFERVLPAIKMGGYIPAVDHQTPPDVSLETYKLYVKLLKEYCSK